ncbi:hypothetical protein [Actinomadura mexicana]|uniref:Uncharacterized protein n=1 Tax=Actinomadura mexicana TaxID=134959 RepID=A0A239CXY5_9ACTN|nr:hypothetical protein [Actinomadura mexicana]SNS24414.1 hypothetical protein SAMN06265355_113152 [Actinomadura mexicana]
MTTGNDSAGGPVDLTKQPPPTPVPDRGPGPAWIVVPARVVALIVVIPLRFGWDLAVLAARGVRAAWSVLKRVPGRFARLVGRMLRGTWRALYRWLLAPTGRLLAAVGRGVAALLDLLLVRPLRWLAVVVVLGFLRWFGRGTGRLARWVHRVLIAPTGRFLALLGRGLGGLLALLLLRPLRALGRGLAWLFGVLAHGLGLLLKGIGLLIGVLVVLPAVLLWRYVLRPPLLGLAWLARALWAGLTWLGRGTRTVLGALGGALAAGRRAFAAAVAWSWRLIGRCLAWLGRVLILAPARAVWRYLLAPVVAGAVGTWRLAARILRWLWRTLVVVPVQVLVVAPARWVRQSVLRPIGHGIRSTWRVTVRAPLRAARQTMREAARDVRLIFRR